MTNYHTEKMSELQDEDKIYFRKTRDYFREVMSSILDNK